MDRVSCLPVTFVKCTESNPSFDIAMIMPGDQLNTRLIILAKWLFKAFVYLIFFVLLYLLVQLWASQKGTGVVAPDIQGTTLQGENVSLIAMRGRPVLVYFWGSWCSICRFEHGSITSLANDYQVLTVALQSGDDEEIRHHMIEHDAVYPVVNDQDGELSASYGIRGVPSSFILNSQGVVDAAFTGYTMEAVLRYRLWRLDVD